MIGIADEPVGWGYTLVDLERIARAAAKSVWVRSAWPMTELHDIAWQEVAELLAAAVEQPAREWLIQQAMSAVYRATQDEWHHIGWGARVDGVHAPSRGHAAYWTPTSYAPQPEELVVERTALSQVWQHLHRADREVIATMAAYGDTARAAAAMGISRQAFIKRILGARRRFWLHWYQGETPQRVLYDAPFREADRKRHRGCCSEPGCMNVARARGRCVRHDRAQVPAAA